MYERTVNLSLLLFIPLYLHFYILKNIKKGLSKALMHV